MDKLTCKKKKKEVISFLNIIIFIYLFFPLFSLYNNGWRDANSLRSWAFQYLPSKVIELDGKNFSVNILRDSKPWLIDFYGKFVKCEY